MSKKLKKADAAKAEEKGKVKSAARPEKKEAILEAMLDLIAERGFHDAPMSELVKRSGASAGVIYHYFPSKEDIIHALYRRIRSMKAEVMLGEYAPERSPREVFCAMWVRAYNFYRSHSRETRFLDLYLNSTFCKPTSGEEETTLAPHLDTARAHFMKLARPKNKGGVLKDLPKTVIEELTFNLAARLARREETIKPAGLERTAEAIWLAIAAE